MSSSEAGVGLVVAMMVLVSLSSLGAAIVALATTEAQLSANHRQATQMLYAAEAAAEHALYELRETSDWNAVLRGGRVSRLGRPGSIARLADGSTLELARVADAGISEGRSGRGDLSPRNWRLFLHAPFDRLVRSRQPSSWQVAVWVADDVAEHDGDGLADTNNVMVLHAACFGPGRAHRAVRVIARRRESGWVEVVSWEVVR